MGESEYKAIRILSLDGSDLYRAMHYLDGEQGFSIRDQRGKLNTSRFRGFLDASLDTDRLKRVYAEHKELKGSFRVCKEYTTAVVNVSFDYSVKKYYNKGKNLFVRDGYDVQWGMLQDHVYMAEEDGQQVLAAVETADKRALEKGRYAPVENPVSSELLPPFLVYDAQKKAYVALTLPTRRDAKKTSTPIDAVHDREHVRAWLYEHGFDIDGVHYVRYKRSAGSSREGHCLFIAEPLYADMMEWSSCGLDGASVSDQASFQAYISLTLSSIEKKIHIPRQSIMIIKDQVSRFRDTVVKVSERDEMLYAEKTECDIENIIWDGEALLDSSVFVGNGYGQKGMMLLRNRFFKTCAFNTNLTAWFADHGITKLSQLSGYRSRSARSLEDIKLIITESSLKYLKFKPTDVTAEEWFERWLDHIYADKETSLFGVVKTDKPTGPMDNRMVKTNYQLINTLGLSCGEVAQLLEPSLHFLRGMQTDPMFVRYHTNLFVADTYEGEDFSNTENYRHRLLSDLSRRSEDFVGTAFYRNYRTELCKNFKHHLKQGRILVDGGYHTLFGNGLEFLHAVIDKHYQVSEPLALGDGEIYTPRFGDGEDLLCERSPHITMGNLLIAKNKYVADIDRYFNLGSAQAIVCVNAIKSNLQQRLNGCDYDSDSMLITNHPILCGAAMRDRARFFVPCCDVKPGGKVAYTTSPTDLAKLDLAIARNQIGEIVNLSQFLNSLYWDKLAHGAKEEELQALYIDICKLAVLSGMEIDKAKRLYPVSAGAVLEEIRGYKKSYREANGTLPAFFSFITEGPQTEFPTHTLSTAMSFVFDGVNERAGRAPRSTTVSYAELFDLAKETGDPTGAYSKRRDAILTFVEEAQGKIRRLNFISKKKNRAEKLLAMEEAERYFDECKEKIAKVADDHLLRLLLRELDLGEMSKKDVSAFHALLFAAMCYANGGYLMKKLKKADCEMLDLIPLARANLPADAQKTLISVFGHPHVMGRKYQ